MLRARTSPEALLKQYDLRITDCRQQVLEAFFGHDYALSHAELEHLLSAYDRVTLYRTLTTFSEKGLLHRVLDDSGTMKYALCAEHCQEHNHHDDHVHFKCHKCGHTECLDGVHIPAIALPEGYKPHELNLLVQGVCKNCA
jgi:Fur family ferric uptake transcriptional regulator